MQFQEEWEANYSKNEGSQFLNGQLFPLINQFERNLRRVVYIFAAFSDDPNQLETVKKLEDLTFEGIYKLLFCDKDMNKKIAEGHRCKSWRKEELMTFLRDYEETIIWNTITKDPDLDIADEFYRAKEYRNDVMHAHQMNYDKYCDAKQLFEKLNTKLDSAIEGVLSIDFEIFGGELSSFISAVDSFMNSDEPTENISRALQVLAQYLKTHGIDKTNGE